MASDNNRSRFTFPRWANYVVPVALLAVVAGLPYKLMLIGFALNPTTLNVGYQPKQPVAYSHELHVGQLGLDCRYCHNTVEKSAFAALPPTQTCMNCHYAVKKTDRLGSEEEIAKIAAAFESGAPLQWKQVHDLPDYAYFNHSIHVNAGVSCVECHGRIDKADGDRNRVAIEQPLSMGWCVNCHRQPGKVLRPRDQVTNLGWGDVLTEGQVEQLKGLKIKDLSVKAGESLTKDQRAQIGHELFVNTKIRNAKQMTDCSACHR